MTNLPVFADGEREEKSNCRYFDYWTESFMVVDAPFLMETLGNQAGFESVNTSIKRKFSLVYPSTSNDRSIGGTRNQRPGTVADESRVLILHGLNPMGVFGGRVVIHRFRNKVRGGGVALR